MENENCKMKNVKWWTLRFENILIMDCRIESHKRSFKQHTKER